MSTDDDDVKWFTHTSSTQTMRTWTRQITSAVEIPPEYQSVLPADYTPFPYTLLTPEDRKSPFIKRNEQLICLLENRILILERTRNRIKPCSVRLDDIFFLEHGKVLLNSWLKIVTADDCISLNFNTTNEHLFFPLIEKARQQTGAASDLSRSKLGDQFDGKIFDYLSTENFKYMNYGKSVIRPNDPVLCIAYQSERALHEFRLFNKTLFQRQSTGHLAILTEKELIIIKEDKRIKQDQENRYGGIFTYIRRDQIQEIQFAPHQKISDCLMTIIFPENIQITAEFSLDNADLSKLQESLSSEGMKLFYTNM